MELVAYNRQQLNGLIESNFFKNLKNIPITTHRALSHIHNPDSADEDILLWAAYESDNLVGYVGALPEVFFFNHQPKKIYWLSCFWVDEAFRNKNVASSLFFLLVKQYRNNLVIANFIPSLEKTYQRLGIFQPTQIVYGHKFFLDFCLADILSARFPKLTILKSAWKLLDSCLSILASPRILFYKKLQEGKYLFEENSYFDHEFQTLINSFSKNSCIRRSAAHFEWILAYPWVLEGEPDEESKRYFFSSKAKRFEYNSVKIWEDKKLIGYFLLKIRNNALSISYIYVPDNVIPAMAAYLFNIIKIKGLKTILTFDRRLIEEIRKNRFRFILERTVRRLYILPKGMNVDVATFQEGDGDIIFT